jgi:Domain of unknown function (DUF4440)
MKIRSLVALAGLTISFALPTFAQQKDTIDSQIDEQVTKKINEAFNNGDAAALATLFTQGAVWVTPQGPVFGRETIQQRFCRDVPARALQQPSQDGRSGFPHNDRSGWQ